VALSFLGCYNYEVQIIRPSDESSIIFESVYAPISLVRHPLSSSFLSFHCQRNLPAVMYAKNQNDRERTRFFHIFPRELRISPEETLTALPFPDIFSIASRCNRSISLHARRRRPVVSATTIRELICSLQRHYVKRSFFRHT